MKKWRCVVCSYVYDPAVGDPDNGVIVCAYLGSALMAGAYLAIACMTSAMTRNQVSEEH